MHPHCSLVVKSTLSPPKQPHPPSTPSYSRRIFTNSKWLYSIFSFNPCRLFDFFACACAAVLVLHHPPGLPLPSNSTGTPPTHLLALCHHHHPSLNRLQVDFSW